MSLKEFSADNGAAIADEAPAGTEQFAMLALDLVVPSLTNPRTTFNEAKLAELAESIRASGVHQPILVRPLPVDRVEETSYQPMRATDAYPFPPRSRKVVRPTHEIVSGERRYRASVLAEQKTIPAMIRALTDAEVLEIQIVENLQRADLTELEEAEGYQRLCEQTGITKEEIGGRIGKSRAYVYGRMKLLDLTSAPREALRNGEIDASKALLIARIPDEKLQLKALEEATEKDHQGSPRMSYRALQTWVQQNVMLKLASARFSIVDANLVPAAGACPDCPKRTGANPDLFSDVDGPDVCIDPTCFHEKETAHTLSLVAIARARGQTIIEGREAKEVKPNEYSSLVGYTELDRSIYTGTESKDLRDLLSAKELKREVKLLVDPHSGQMIEVVSNEVMGNARERARSKGRPQDTPSERKRDAEWEADQERKRLESEYQKRWRAAAIATLRPRVAAGELKSLTAAMMRRLLLELSGVNQRCSDEDVADAIGLSDENGEPDEDLFESTIRATHDHEVGYSVLVALLLSDRIAGWRWDNGVHTVNTDAPMIEDMAASLGVDLDAIKAEVQAQIRAEREPKAPAADQLAAPQEGSAKGKNSKPAAQARKGKTTKEEASASIAAALQELDAGPGAETGGGAPPALSPQEAWPFPKTARP